MKLLYASLLYAVVVSTCYSRLINHDQDICEQTVTTVSGDYAPTGPLCKGQLIFSEEFDDYLDSNLWTHEQRLSPNGEFQWYVNDTENSFVEQGKLIIMPTLTTDVIPDLTNCFINISTDVCQSGVCVFNCSKNFPAPPVRTARIKTNGNFNFKYAYVEIRAKMPAGDWLWPALWMIPSKGVYGPWPKSGEIDILESRGNRQLLQGSVDVGANQFASTLNFGTTSSNSAWRKAHFTKNLPRGELWSHGFHVYQLAWTPDYLKFYVDNILVGSIPTGNGYYALGNFTGPNIWANGNPDAPFDQEFHFIVNTAVGGTSGYFADSPKKPWRNAGPYALRDFWNNRDDWLATWHLDEDSRDAALEVDYIRAWAV